MNKKYKIKNIISKNKIMIILFEQIILVDIF